jgi:hypothetical protein
MKDINWAEVLRSMGLPVNWLIRPPNRNWILLRQYER